MSHSMRRTGARLLRHDRLIVANELRSAFSRWSDRLIAIAVLAIALAALRSSLSARPFILAAAAVAVFAAVAGAGAARIIERRLAFHAEDGVIAADALAGSARRHFVLSVHLPVCGVVTLCTAISRPMTALLVPFAYLAGAGLCHLAHRLAGGGGARRRALFFRPATRLLQRPAAGAVAAIAAIAPQLLLQSIGAGPLAAFVGLVSGVAALLLTSLDHDVVRFMSASGYRAGRIIALHVRPLLVFLALTVPASLILSGRLAAIVVIGIVLAAFLLMTARILAYRAYSKRTADTAVSAGVAFTCFAGFMMPMLLPLVAAAILWHLQRRSAPATWLLA